MANLTVDEVLAQVDSLLPNTCTAQQKLHWLHQAESLVVSLAGGQPPQRPLSGETELTVPPPYDELYRHYVEAQIHYAAGETERCNNAAALWNSAFLSYRDCCLRTAAPGSRALKLC